MDSTAYRATARTAPGDKRLAIFEREMTQPIKLGTQLEGLTSCSRRHPFTATTVRVPAAEVEDEDEPVGLS